VLDKYVESALVNTVCVVALRLATPLKVMLEHTRTSTMEDVVGVEPCAIIVLWLRQFNAFKMFWLVDGL
jgi:hypothetical protein